MTPTRFRSGAYSVACLVAAVLTLGSERWLMGVLLLSVTVLHEVALNSWAPWSAPSSHMGWRHG